ncbi:Nif3-like dinuclear metal center hexameric protein [Gracilibacillus sp. HCP3S3_G5_1]|uniref:Nif3-like dinuclear metal center hexameric protein n=1 Tax=unclassified Gracilibacillus TaxID=2625209 RepID=UPI003F899CF1
MITIQHVIDQMEDGITYDPSTVDGLKYGNREDIVKGIAVSFMPSMDVIQRTADINANLLITHEGLFYQHQPNQALEAETTLIKQKKSIIKQTNLAIYRNHDAVHRSQPDGITLGLIEALNWQHYIMETNSNCTIVHLPNATLEKVASHLKEKLSIEHLRFVGNMNTTCEHIAVLSGYRGNGMTTIPLFEKVDLVIYGEGPEWETPEFVWDVTRQGNSKGLIQLGHAESEDPGMERLAKQLQHRFPSVPVTFIPTKSRFQLI